MTLRGKEKQCDNRLYASVVFKNAEAVYKAMELDGTDLNGQPLVVRQLLTSFVIVYESLRSDCLQSS